MKNIFKLMILVAAMLFFGCKAILIKMYGLKDPEFESHEAILKFQDEIGFKGIPYYGMKADCWAQNKVFSAPDVFVFNSDGKYIPYKDTLKPNCNGPAEMFLTELDSDKAYIFSQEYTLSTFLDMLEGPDCQPLIFDQQKDVDFYIFMTYSVFSGKRIFREKSEIWYDSLKNNKKIRYELYMVNEDFKACWSEEQKNQFESKK